MGWSAGGHLTNRLIPFTDRFKAASSGAGASDWVPTTLYVAPREGHNWAELRPQMNKGNVEIEWFERYVTGRACIPEKAPGDAETKLDLAPR